jgi:hypothetical protein
MTDPHNCEFWLTPTGASVCACGASFRRNPVVNDTKEDNENE